MDGFNASLKEIPS